MVHAYMWNFQAIDIYTVQDFAMACKRIKEDQAAHDPLLGPAGISKLKSYVLEGAWLTYCVAATARGHEPRQLRLKDVCGFDLQPSHIVGMILLVQLLGSLYTHVSVSSMV